MTSDDLPSANVHLWEATFSAFTDELQLIPANQINSVTVQNHDVLVFIGEERGVIPQEMQESIKQFKGRMIAFGHNAEQLEPYATWHFSGEEKMRTLDEHSLPTALSVMQFRPPSQSEILSVGRTLEEEIPFIAQEGQYAYIGSTSIGMAEKIAVSRSIYKLLDEEPPKSHPAYIRLEDISPITDPRLVKEAGDYLAERGIPFYMAIIPVYVNSETGEKVFLSENKELIQVLLDLQKRGGMVIAHGYTHAYRLEETGEGFEFWDVELNQKITTVQSDEPSFLLKRQSTFPTQEAYELYINEMDWIEEQYINLKQTQSIEQLGKMGLYPLAFEAPHYTMSSSGYRVTSSYFSSIFGQLQLSDEDWEVMNTPLFLSNPAIASGMTLYPETIGFVDPSLADPLADMEVAIEQLKTVPGSMIGGFYHPYIGLEYLPEMVELIESVGNIEWLDLRETSQLVETKHMTIKQEAGKSLEISSTISRMDSFLQQLKERPFEASLWIMALVVALFILAFFIYISGLRVRLRKRLFEERKHIG